jgi:hypothetical protein
MLAKGSETAQISWTWPRGPGRILSGKGFRGGLDWMATPRLGLNSNTTHTNFGFGSGFI